MQSIEKHRKAGDAANGDDRPRPSCGLNPVVAAEQLALHFRVLSEPMRIRIVQLLHHGERTVSQVAEELGAAQANVSRHVHILRDAGIVALRHDGTAVWCAIRDSGAVAACDRVCRSLGQQLAGNARLARKLKS